MVFADLLFVFIFFVFSYLSQVAIPTVRGKNIALLCFSLVFYTWAGVRFLLVLLVMVLIAKIGAEAIEEAKALGKSGKARMIETIALLLGFLCFFKYMGFFGSVLNAAVPSVALPIGISFYTFQLISYTADVYRGEVKAQDSYWKLLLYTSLFHQCIAGPIVRYKDVYEDLRLRKMTVEDISRGVTRFSIGLAKKAIIANGIAQIIDPVLDGATAPLVENSALVMALCLCLHAMQYYFDFSAYSDMAIGMGLMCGLHYKENFNYPFISESVGEIWRRWHISLGTFFRDYVYIPLGGSRGTLAQNLFSLFVVWALTGFWHGAGFNFIIWGLCFFVLIVIERYIGRRLFGSLPSVIKRICIFFIFSLVMIFLHYTDLNLALDAIKGVFLLNGNPLFKYEDMMILSNNIWFLIVCFLFATPLGNAPRLYLMERAKTDARFLKLSLVVETCIPVVLLVLSACALAGNSYNPFLYFQF